METGRASIAAAGAAAVAGEDCARLRFGARFLVAIAAGGADFASCAVDDDAAADPDDFAARAEDGDGSAAIIVASPKASVKASLVASGGEGFARLRLGPRFFLVRAADFLAASRTVAGDAAVADAFRFLGMGLCVVAAGRRLEISAGVRCC